MLTRSPDRSLTEQLAERFAERIRTRLLPAGARLPSVRECARQQGVSPYTVVAAYDKLLAQGLVEARRQRGFYVRDFVQKSPLALDGKAQTAILSEATAASPLGPMGLCLAGSRINATALIRGMFHQASNKPQPGSSAGWMSSATHKPFIPTVIWRQSPSGYARTIRA